MGLSLRLEEERFSMMREQTNRLGSDSFSPNLILHGTPARNPGNGTGNPQRTARSVGVATALHPKGPNHLGRYPDSPRGLPRLGNARHAILIPRELPSRLPKSERVTDASSAVRSFGGRPAFRVMLSRLLNFPMVLPVRLRQHPTIFRLVFSQ